MTKTPKTFAIAQKGSSVLARVQASASRTDAGPQKHTQLNIQNLYIDTNNKAESTKTHSHHTSFAQYGYVSVYTNTFLTNAVSAL